MIAQRSRRSLFVIAAIFVAGAALFSIFVPASVASASDAPDVAVPVKMSVPLYHQTLSDDCEASSLRMILAYRGHRLTDMQVLGQIGVDRAHPHAGFSGRTSGDPYRAFVGNPDGSEVANTGFGVYYPRIAAAAHANHLTVLAAGNDIPTAVLYRQLAAGHPAEVWIDYLYRHKTASHYRAYDGREVLYAGPAEHAVALIGVTPTGVWVNDPARGSYLISKAKFEAGYATYQNMAVVIG